MRLIAESTTIFSTQSRLCASRVSVPLVLLKNRSGWPLMSIQMNRACGQVAFTDLFPLPIQCQKYSGCRTSQSVLHKMSIATIRDVTSSTTRQIFGRVQLSGYVRMHHTTKGESWTTFVSPPTLSNTVKSQTTAWSGLFQSVLTHSRSRPNPAILLADVLGVAAIIPLHPTAIKNSSALDIIGTQSMIVKN